MICSLGCCPERWVCNTDRPREKLKVAAASK